MTVDKQQKTEVLSEGKFLRLVRKDRWEFVERTKPVGSVFIGALTVDGCLLLIDEYRIPVEAAVIGCPAGLIGDCEGDEGEDLETAVKRELLEEAGYEAETVTLLTRGPTSSGQTDEVISIVLATKLRKVGAGGGIGSEQIVVHEVPLSNVDEWLRDKQRAGRLIDPKVYTVLYFVR